jgi:serine/threonine protein phosphatase PrpC
MSAPQIDSQELETADYPAAPREAKQSPARFFGPAQPPVEVEFGAVTHPGKVRPNNEDHYLVQRHRRTLSVITTNLPPEYHTTDHVHEDAYSMAVADGMGGMAFGELASAMALRTAMDLILSAIKWSVKLNESEIRELKERIGAYFDLIDQTLIDQGWLQPRAAGMATTLTGAYSVGPEVFIAHAGDSRAYVFGGGTLKRLTHDHTLAQELADFGAIRPEEVATHRLRNTLTNYLGGPREGVSPDVVHVRLADGDSLMLCTDGLSDLVTDDEIARVMGRFPIPQDACQALVDLALERGGKDNVTVVIGKYTFPKG